jgi:hypothetical protein
MVSTCPTCLVSKEAQGSILATDDRICCRFCKRLSQRSIEEVQEQNVPNSAQLQHSKFTKSVENISNMGIKYRPLDKDSDLQLKLHPRIRSSELRAYDSPSVTRNASGTENEYMVLYKSIVQHHIRQILTRGPTRKHFIPLLI